MLGSSRQCSAYHDAPREVITCFKGSPKEFFGSFSFFKFENRSRTTCSRFLRSFALPDEAVQLQTAQHSTAQHSTAQHSTAQHSTAQHSTAQHSTAQHSTAQHSTAQHTPHRSKRRAVRADVATIMRVMVSLVVCPRLF